MIPKPRIMALAEHQRLPPTTIQKDYVLGWFLQAITAHPVLGTWVFKGGTCLKKCFFDTYRFSEDLDFTIPNEKEVSVETLMTALGDAASWVEDRCGITFPRTEWKVDEYTNPRGNKSYRAKLPFSGPVGLPRRSLQRVKLDLTQDELIADTPKLRNLYHGYEDAPDSGAQVLCYSINELLAEKTRALVERHGRARDVYDIVNLSRNFREEIDADVASKIADQKFEFKGLPSPDVAQIVGAIDKDVLRANWQHQLGHQLPLLPNVETFFDDLFDALAWWLAPTEAKPLPEPNPKAKGAVVPRQFFSITDWRIGPSPTDRIRYAARNRMCALVSYHGSVRLVEPYSLRYIETGNQLLHVWEVEKNGLPSQSHKSCVTSEIADAEVSTASFSPKWLVEL